MEVQVWKYCQKLLVKVSKTIQSVVFFIFNFLRQCRKQNFVKFIFHYPGVWRITQSRKSRSGVALCTTNLASPGLQSSLARLKHISSSGQPFCTDCNATSDLDTTTKKLTALRKSFRDWNLASNRAESKVRSDLEFGNLGYQRLRTQVQIWRNSRSRRDSRILQGAATSHGLAFLSVTGHQ